MIVTVVDVGEVLVLVGDHEVPMPAAGEHDDRVGSVVGILGVDRVHVLDGFVNVAMTVVGGRDDEHAGEGDRERDERGRGEVVTVDRPGEDGADERCEGEDLSLIHISEPTRPY